MHLLQQMTASQQAIRQGYWGLQCVSKWREIGCHGRHLGQQGGQCCSLRSTSTPFSGCAYTIKSNRRVNILQCSIMYGCLVAGPHPPVLKIVPVNEQVRVARYVLQWGLSGLARSSCNIMQTPPLDSTAVLA